jgi:hypothetical protein
VWSQNSALVELYYNSARLHSKLGYEVRFGNHVPRYTSLRRTCVCARFCRFEESINLRSFNAASSLIPSALRKPARLQYDRCSSSARYLVFLYFGQRLEQFSRWGIFRSADVCASGRQQYSVEAIGGSLPILIEVQSEPPVGRWILWREMQDKRNLIDRQWESVLSISTRAKRRQGASGQL